MKFDKLINFLFIEEEDAEAVDDKGEDPEAELQNKIAEKNEAKEEFPKNNDAVNTQNRLELKSFVNDFYQLFDSGYTPIDLKI